MFQLTAHYFPTLVLLCLVAAMGCLGCHQDSNATASADDGLAQDADVALTTEDSEPVIAAATPDRDQDSAASQPTNLPALADIDPSKDEQPASKAAFKPISPDRDAFQAAYDAAPTNHKHQSFEEYFRWLQAFYAGNFAEAGWNRRCAAKLDKLEFDSTTGAKLTSKMTELGNVLAAEWAKDRRVGKIKNADLMTYGKRIEKIQSATDLLQELDAILAEAKASIEQKSP